MMIKRKPTQQNTYLPIHVVRHAYSAILPLHSTIHPAPFTDTFIQNKGSVVTDGITFRAQRLQLFSRQLNEFTTTNKRVKTFVSNINGKNQNDWPGRKIVPAAKKGPVPETVQALPVRGLV